jgi:anti-sigma factor RsiW
VIRRREMSCRELVELVTEYLEGTLSRRDRKRFEAHIAGCEYCTTYVEQMREVISTLGRLTEDSIAPRARQELLVAFRDWH